MRAGPPDLRAIKMSEKVKLTVDGVEEIFEGETLKEAKDKQNARMSALRSEFNAKHGDDVEEDAEGKTGFLLYSPFTEKHFFRIYDPNNKRIYTDYRLSAEDIEVTILAGGLSLYKNKEGENRLDWSSKVLGRHKGK